MSVYKGFSLTRKAKIIYGRLVKVAGHLNIGNIARHIVIKACGYN